VIAWQNSEEDTAHCAWQLLRAHCTPSFGGTPTSWADMVQTVDTPCTEWFLLYFREQSDSWQACAHRVWQLLRAHSKLLEELQGVNLVRLVVESGSCGRVHRGLCHIKGLRQELWVVEQAASAAGPAAGPVAEPAAPASLLHSLSY